MTGGILKTIFSGLETPSDETILRRAIEFRVSDIHTAMPAVVTSYDPVHRTVTVRPAFAHVRELPDGTVAFDDYGVLFNIPVMFPSGGGFRMIFPIKPGDFVMLVFAERSMHTFLNSSGSPSLATRPLSQKHDLNDAVAFPGFKLLNPAPAADGDVDGGKLHIGQEGVGNNDIIIDESGIAISGEMVTLGSVTVNDAPHAVARAGDVVNVTPAGAPDFFAWIAAVSAAAASPVPVTVPAFTGTIVGRIVSGSAKVSAA